MIDCGRPHGLGWKELVRKHLAVRKGAVARPQTASGGERGQFVAAGVEFLPYRLPQLLPSLVDRRTMREDPRVVGDVAEACAVGFIQLSDTVLGLIVRNPLDKAIRLPSYPSWPPP
jgi:hypothetical protein